VPDHLILSYLLIKLYLQLFSNKRVFSLCVHGGECRCASECVIPSDDQAGLTSEYVQPGSQEVSGPLRATSGCESTSVSLTAKAQAIQLWDQRVCVSERGLYQPLEWGCGPRGS